MKYTVSVFTNIKDKYIKRNLYNLNKYLLKQDEKVSYAYKNLITNDIFSFNLDVCFYAASSIKILVCLYLYEQAEKDPNILDNKITLTSEDFKQGSGVLKNNKEKLEYTIRELIYYSLKDSDNTAYIKLMNYVKQDELKEYGLSLGATHTLEGKDLFGIINASDMICYLTRLYEYLNRNTKLSNELKAFMSNPSYKIIDLKNVDNNLFVRKYGSYGIAFHEVGLVYDKRPYILIILTQKNELRKSIKERYINKVAKKINKINKLINWQLISLMIN